MQSNFFDDLTTGLDPEETLKHQQEMQAKYARIDKLIHQTFAQSESGRELLAIWKDALCMAPTANPGDEMLTVGINEGQKQFIRNILLTIQKVENDE
jgi:hypothetical protein